MFKKIGAAFTAMAVVATSPIWAEPYALVPGLKISAEERPLLPRLAMAMALLPTYPKETLDDLNALLELAQNPTVFRGMIQLLRAGALANLNELGKAAPAIAEAIRLMPDSAAPKLAGSQIYIFTGAVGEAADLWLSASRQDSNLARTTNSYVIMALLGRLDDIGDRRRADQLRARLLEIGYSSGSQAVLSDITLSVIRSRMAASTRPAHAR